MGDTAKVMTLAAASAAWILVVGAASGAGEDCSAQDCSGAYVLIAIPYLFFPILAGVLLNPHRTGSARHLRAAASTAGVAGLATAVATLLFVDAGDSDRGAFVVGWIIVAPVATLIALPLVAVGGGLSSRERGERFAAVARLSWVVGALLILVASLMPWTVVSSGTFGLTTSGIEGNRWGVGTLLCGLLIIGAAASRSRAAPVVIITAAAAATLIGIVVLASPSAHASPPDGLTESLQSGGGTILTVAGGLLVLLGSALRSASLRRTLGA